MIPHCIELQQLMILPEIVYKLNCTFKMCNPTIDNFAIECISWIESVFAVSDPA